MPHRLNEREPMHIHTMFAAALLAATPAWAINKCKTPEGKTVFQDAPCAGGGITVAEDLEKKKEQQKKVAAPAESTKPISSISEDVERRLREAQQKSDDALKTAHARCTNGVPEYPKVGMTEFEFRNCTQHGLLVEHSDVNQTETAAGISKQYVYSGTRNIGIRYVYIRNGVVTAIQR